MVILGCTVVNYFCEGHEICQLGNALYSCLRVNVGRLEDFRLDKRIDCFCEISKERVGGGMTGVTGVKPFLLIRCELIPSGSVLPKNLFALLVDHEDLLLQDIKERLIGKSAHFWVHEHEADFGDENMAQGQNKSLEGEQDQEHGDHIYTEGMFIDQRPRNEHENVDNATADKTREKVAVKEAEIKDAH